MSWFKHKPRLKNPPKLHPHYTSPVAEKILQETKIEVTRTELHNPPLKKKKNER